MIFHSIAWAFDDDGLCMMQEPVKDGGGKGAVVVEDAGPFFIGPVGGDNGSGLFITQAECLEKDVGALFIHGQIAKLIDKQQIGLQVFFKLLLHSSGGLSGCKVVDYIDGGREED